MTLLSCSKSCRCFCYNGRVVSAISLLESSLRYQLLPRKLACVASQRKPAEEGEKAPVVEAFVIPPPNKGSQYGDQHDDFSGDSWTPPPSSGGGKGGGGSGDSAAGGFFGRSRGASILWRRLRLLLLFFVWASCMYGVSSSVLRLMHSAVSGIVLYPKKWASHSGGGLKPSTAELGTEEECDPSESTPLGGAGGRADVEGSLVAVEVDGTLDQVGWGQQHRSLGSRGRRDSSSGGRS